MNNEELVYNQIARKYYNAKRGLYPKKDIEKFISYLQPASSVLDLGCGPGQASKIFCERDYLVTGLDFSEEMIKIARQEVLDAKFIHGDMMNLDKIFIDNFFDGVWACSSVLHLNKKDIPDLFNQIYKVLEKKGVFYTAVKEGKGEEDFIDERYGNIKRHFVYFEKKEMINLLKNSHFKILYSSSSPRNYARDPEHSWINFIARKS